ncbi:hypothetical protein LTR35_014793 [Friedmanniomyces endolithicus]|uniref:Dienelactone hydrolase domain-containing protein n=1 Tax=Friedmanniomyces endolithicus TaxID=329885 RepID=A0AAN6J2U5_9PEZI|nr:hypothetical protein LTR35_014793 [Friedmanniomyces endolithicus]KAK0311693.1 hypothetical protein LTR82_014222 [Friedmanniomyces endolithicus]KAK0984534.1 hypothetical protein LTR54_014032 [Friedmanniomyces endolithicus]
MAGNHSECIKGTIHNGTPQGKEEMLHGLNTYVIGHRTNPRAIIVMYSDIFGLLLPNNKLIADSYAKSGDYLVYLPDFFKGDAVGLRLADLLIPVDAAKQSTLGKYTGLLTSGPSLMMWMGRHKAGPTDDICQDFLRKLRRATPAGRKIGMVGFCWGGKYAIRAGLEASMIEVDGAKRSLVDAVVALHPSNLVLPTDVEAPVVPMTFGWGQEDSQVSIETKGKVEGIHAGDAKKGKQVPEMVHKVYKPGRHGFAVRGNPDDAQERKCLEDSTTQVLEWFGKYL